MKMPKVSIIMPAFNTEKYIAEAIRSTLNQTFQDFELLIVNDGSTDKTGEIIKEYAKQDSRIKVIEHSQNEGTITSLNECLAEAKGQYIAKMDSDDISLPERLEKQVNYLDTHPDVGMVGIGYQFFDKQDRKVILPEEVSYFSLIQGCNTSVVMFRNELIKKYHLSFRKEYLHAEDYEFYTRFVKYAKIHNIPQILYLYRWHGKNVSIQYQKIQEKNTQRIRQECLDFLTKNQDLQGLIKDHLFPCRTTEKKKYYLFKKILLLKIRRKGKTKTYYLFGFIPIFKIEKIF